jgi:hypothetical protein
MWSGPIELTEIGRCKGLPPKAAAQLLHLGFPHSLHFPFLHQQNPNNIKETLFRQIAVMVIIDDKPYNWPAAPPPYMQASGSSSSRNQPENKSNNPYSSTSNNLLSPATANSMLPPPHRVNFVGGNNITSNSNANGSTLSFTSHGNVDDPPPFSRGRQRVATLLDLPQHILLYIVQMSCLPERRRGYSTQRDYDRYQINLDAKGEYRGPGFVDDDGENPLGEEEWAEHAIGLHHLAMNVRLVSRGLYVGQSTRPLMSSFSF